MASQGAARGHVVLLYTRTFGAGSEVWTYRHATGLKRHVCRVAAAYYENRDRFPFPAVHLVDAPGVGHRALQMLCALRTLRPPTTDRLRAWRLKKVVRRTGAELVHVHFLWSAVHAVGCGVPFVITAHGTDVNRAAADEPYRRSLTPVLEAAARVIAGSDFIAGRLRQIGCPPEKVVRIRLGAPLPRETARPEEGAERVRVVCVASLVPVKGHRFLIDAFARAAAAEPRLRLTLVGDGPLRAEIEELICSKGIEGRVERTGWLEPVRVQEVLKGAHIYAQHSVRVEAGPVLQEEGLPVSIVEAAACGLPIVASRTGGVPEICRHGENGHLVEEGDVEEMAERILELARDPRLRSRLGSAGRALVACEFDVEKQLAKLEDLYDEVLGKERKQR